MNGARDAACSYRACKELLQVFPLA